MYVQHFMKFHDPQPLKSKPFSFSIVFVHANVSLNPFAYLFPFLLNLLHLIFAIKKLVQIFESSKWSNRFEMSFVKWKVGSKIVHPFVHVYCLFLLACPMRFTSIYVIYVFISQFWYVFACVGNVIDFIIISDVNGFCLNGNNSTIFNRLLFGAHFHRTTF